MTLLELKRIREAYPIDSKIVSFRAIKVINQLLDEIEDLLRGHPLGQSKEQQFNKQKSMV